MTLISAVINGLRDLRVDLFRHLETRPSSFYDRVAVGRIMTRVTNDVEALYELLRGMGTLIGEFVPFFVALGIMLAVDVKLTIVLLLALPIMGGVTAAFRRATRQLFRLVRMSLSALNQNMQENLAGLQVVQLSERQEYNLGRYTAINRENRTHEMRSMRLETVYGAFTDSMASIALGVVVWYGGGAVVQDHVSLGGIILFTRFIDMLFHPIIALGEQTNILFRAMASGERIFQALDWDEKIHEPASPVALPPRLRGEVEFRHVSFAYQPDVPVLNDVSFTIAPGEKLAIVGPTGSGKSTLIRLLGRFYDFPDGMIFLDGFDLHTIHTRDLRKRIGVVLQDFHIFSGTIYDNIALGNPAISRERAIAAAKTVNAHGFIARLPNGYDTPLSERGQNLSQGQRQLLAFARVLAADPEILVLDEATASIDTETELLIQDALRKLTARRTSILIAHRLADDPGGRSRAGAAPRPSRRNRHARRAVGEARPLLHAAHAAVPGRERRRNRRDAEARASHVRLVLVLTLALAALASPGRSSSRRSPRSVSRRCRRARSYGASRRTHRRRKPKPPPESGRSSSKVPGRFGSSRSRIPAAPHRRRQSM